MLAGLDVKGRTRVDEVVSRTGGTKLLDTCPVRRIKSENYKFVIE